MRLVIHKGRTLDNGREKPYFAPGVLLDLGAKQARFVAAALNLAIERIEEELKNDPNSYWDGNDIPLLQDAVNQLADAEIQLDAYDEQMRWQLRPMLPPVPGPGPSVILQPTINWPSDDDNG